MENTQPMKTENESESKVATSDGSILSSQQANTDQSESKTSSETTPAATPKGSTKTWTSAELAELESKAGLVAGALADFQTAGGQVAVKSVDYKMNGKTFSATKIYLVAENVNILVDKTVDGLDFRLVAEKNETS